MKLKTASTFLLIASIIWLLNDLYWIANGFSEGWLKFDSINFILRVLMLTPPIALIFFSSVLGDTQIQKSENISEQASQSSNDDSLMSVGDWLITFLLCAIPIIGIIMMFVWAFGDTNPKSKKTWAQAALIFSVIITVLYAFITFAIISQY
jgi:hypothetical protein